jgi:dipeptidase
MRLVYAIVATAPFLVDFGSSCTSILVSKGASALNVSMCAHSADCSDCDSRIALVPNRIHNSSSLHPIRGIHHVFPREFSDRATVYFPPNGTPLDAPLGFIPEVNETYAMWESVYGLMNEHGLTIGESSTYARINTPGVDLENPNTHKKGPALFSIAMLIQVALERCKTAVCAVNTMGSLSEKYGFYAETFNAGESLSIADTQGDGWIFHILPDPTGRSSVWAARKVPDGHVAALANQFTISTINSSDSENYLHSTEMYSIAISQGLWNGKSEFRFNHVFGTPGALPMYISVRLWFIYNSVAPSLNLSPRVNPFDFPFSVPVDKKLSIEDIMAIFRSRYEGTEFDMTKGILAGPFGNPQRVDGGDGIKQVGGQVTRPIAIQRTAYTMIGVADPENPLVYYATDTPSTSVFVPFLASTLRKASAQDMEGTKNLYSDRYQTGKKTQFDRYSAWWAFDFVANWMNINYANMSSTFVYPAVREWQPKLIEAAKTKNEAEIIRVTDELVDSWWKMADTLVVTYNDGYYTEPSGKASYTGYPAEFLRSVGFNDGFVYPMGVCPASAYGQCPLSNSEDDLILFRNVNKTVSDLHYLKDVLIPRKFNKTIVVNISEPSFPLVFSDQEQPGESLESVSARQAQPGTSTSGFGEIMWSVAMLAIGGIGGFMIANRKHVSRFANDDVYTRIVAA